MEKSVSTASVSFFVRLRMAFRLLFSSTFGTRVAAGLDALQAPAPVEAPERMHASGLLLLSVLQREGRLLDFVQQDISAASDTEVGAAARVVHGGCRKALARYFDFEPASKEPEGGAITVPAGFNAQRLRLTGNVTGQPPFRGTLRHHGWVARAVRLPSISESLDPCVISPAEIELA